MNTLPPLTREALTTEKKIRKIISMKRSERQTIARQTVEIVERGSYQSPSGRTVSLRAQVEAAKKGTRLYSGDDLSGCGAILHQRPAASLEVTTESTFAAMNRLHQAGALNIGCLNFASARSPGGGFLNGAEAQEEALARASVLYDCLLCAHAYYDRNRAHSSSLYLDLIIASPGVPFFRADDGEFLEEPLPATVITAPAPNAGAVALNEPASVPEIVPVLRARVEMVLHVAVLHGVRNLVLGAWGCGVFRNDPHVVARAFADQLKPDGLYAGSFDRVVFAVFDPTGCGPNYTAFKEEFST